MEFEINVEHSLIVAILVLGVGAKLNKRLTFLSNYNIPAAVTGGLICSSLVAICEIFFDLKIRFDMAQRDTLLLVFFSTIGLSAKLSRLREGGRALAWMALLATGFLIIQNTVGLTIATLFGVDPFYGLIAGSISFSGGHGTTITWGQLAASKGLVAAPEIGLACATIGLVAGGLVGGPVAHRLIRTHSLSGDPEEEACITSPESKSKFIPVTLDGMLNSIFLLTVCVAAGAIVNEYLKAHGYTVPGFLTSLAVGVVLTNTMDLMGRDYNPNAIGLCSDISLQLFLGLSLMSMQLTTIFGNADKLVLVTICQVAVMVAYAYFIVFRVMGKDYDACVIAVGYIGMGLGATPVGIANMHAITEKYGASTKAFLVIPLIGAFFVDIANAVVIQGFLALPAFDW
ncbi:MAG: sodium/glutamate symporter [Rubripirellula sp.]